MADLSGIGVLLTRPAGENDPLAAVLRERGADVFELPCGRIEHLEDVSELAAAVRALGPEDRLVVTSGAGVDAVVRAVRPEEIRAPVAAVGPATARRCAERGLVAWTPSRPNGAALGAELPLASGIVLLARADRADREIVRQLEIRGARVREVLAYRSVPGVEGDVVGARAGVASGALRTVVFYSPTSVDGLADAFGPASLRGLAFVTVGQTTARHVRERLGTEAIVADSTALEDMLAAVARAAQEVANVARS